jgi:hypothetical protein
MTGTNGVLWNTLFQGDEDNVRHLLYGSILWRDWDFDNTSLTGFNPFGADGNLVDTLFEADNPGGPWYDSGYVDEKGFDFNQSLKSKETQVMQSRRPIRWDFTEDTEEVSTTLMESNPINDALRDNRPLNSSLPQVGSIGYSTSTPVERDILFRQLMIIGVDGTYVGGLNYYIVRVYPRVLVTDFGRTTWNPDNADSLPVKVEAVPDPWTVPPSGYHVGSPRIIFRDGPGWRKQGQANFQTTVPVATAETTTTASLAFPTPAGLVAPITYTATLQTTSSGSFTSATLSNDTGTVTGGTTTLSVTSLTASTSYNAFKVTATDANSTAVTSAASNSITTT